MNFYRDFYRFFDIFEYSNNSTLVIVSYRIVLRVYTNNTNNITSRVFSREEDSELRTFLNIILELYKIRPVYLYID